MTFESFINDYAIPENWKVISSRLDVTKLSYTKQRMKIIGEIVEYFEANENYRNNFSADSYMQMLDELADICIACCTLLRLQERKYIRLSIPGFSDEISWINKVVTRQHDALLTSIYDFSVLNSLDLCGAMRKKIAYNATRKDW